MSRGKKKGCLLAAALLMGITGCGKNEIPALTDEELQKISEFTAFTLMKYDTSHQSRLVDLEELGLEVTGGSTEIPDIEVPDQDGSALPDKDPADGEGQEEPGQTGMDPVDDTPVVNEPDQTPGESYTMEEVLDLPEGILLVFAGQEVCGSYPEEENAYFSLEAEEGKQLLVLHFQVSNTGEQEQNVDILSLKPQFRITVNETLSRQALPTMLEEDLVFLQADIPAGDSKDAVLVVEVDQDMAENITALSLSINHDGKKCYGKIL